MPQNLSQDAPRDRTAASAGADGREHGRIVRRYLAALETEKSGKSRKRGLDAMHNRLLKIDELLVTADPLQRLHLTQERIDIHGELVRVNNGSEGDFAALEAEFVRVAKAYGDYSGITFAAWRQVGVAAEVLEQAGIARPTPAAPKGETRSDGAAQAKADDAASADHGGNRAPAAQAPTKPKSKKAASNGSAPKPKAAAAPNPDSPSMRRKRLAASGSDA